MPCTAIADAGYYWHHLCHEPLFPHMSIFVNFLQFENFKVRYLLGINIWYCREPLSIPGTYWYIMPIVPHKLGLAQVLCNSSDIVFLTKSSYRLFFSDLSHLPTVATCFNTLCLPAYHSKMELCQKLQQAIELGVGFYRH